MKILLINNYHFKKGGAERAYFDTAEILESHGHEVAFFSTKHPRNFKTIWEKYFIENVDFENENFSIWKKIKIAQNIIFNFKAKRNLEKLIKDFKPDIAHLHNIYHQLSPSIIYALKKHSIPMVMTLHDYKLISPNYSLFLNGKIWEGKSIFKCIKDKCVKNSYVKSTICVLEKLTHDLLRSYRKIDLFIAPSKFLMEKFQEFSFKGEMEYMPYPIYNNFSSCNLVSETKGAIVYYGRLSKEKGVDVLVRAMKFLNQSENLQILGEGPEKENLIKLAKELRLESQVKLLGFKSGEELQKILKEAKTVVVPSVWYENMPYCVTEPLHLGIIVIGSNIGGIAELISDGKNGFLFKSGSPEDLAEKIKNLEKNNLEKISREAQKSIITFSYENYYKRIIKEYENISKLRSAILLDK